MSDLSILALPRPGARAEVGWAILGGLAVGGLLAWTGPIGLALVVGLIGAAGAIQVARRAPTLVVALWLTVAVGVRSLADIVSVPIGGGIDLWLSDPILFMMSGALAVELLRGDMRSYRSLFQDALTWTLLLAWVVFRTVESMGAFGVVSALGEFRTYFQQILVVPYILVFARTPTVRRRMLLTTVWLALGLIIIGLVRGGFYYGFSFAPYEKWLVSTPSLAVVYGAFGLYLMRRYQVWTPREVVYAGIMILVLAVTVVSGHRSVWLATAAGLCTMTLLGHVPIGKVVKLVAAGSAVVILLDLAYDDISLLDFLSERFKAFFAARQDDTTNWRLHLWASAWEQSQQHLWTGKGLGNYFYVTDDLGNVVEVQLHNQYIQLVYQVGLTGLVLYLLFVAQAGLRLLRAYRRSDAASDAEPTAAPTTALALVVLMSASAFYIAYGFDPFSWVFISIGLAVAGSRVRRREPEPVPNEPTSEAPASNGRALAPTNVLP